MRVFVCWSQEPSRELAEAVHRWLPRVLQNVKPFMSSADVYKGARWLTEIASELDQADFGILCITPENTDSPWLNFEAGALSTSFEQGRVSPLLFGLRETDITGPLTQFQATVFEESEMRKLVASINEASGEEALDKDALDESFDVWWPRLEAKVEPILERLKTHVKRSESGAPNRSTPELLQEVLELTRSQQRLLASPADLLPPEYLREAVGRDRPLDPAALEQLADSWASLEQLLSDGATPGDEAWREIRELAERLRLPVTYLTRRGSWMRQGRVQRIPRRAETERLRRILDEPSLPEETEPTQEPDATDVSHPSTD